MRFKGPALGKPLHFFYGEVVDSMLDSQADRFWMAQALDEAHAACREDEIPVGAVLVSGKQRLAVAHNRSVVDQDPTAHAEILVLRRAAHETGNYRLPGTTLYVTLEPCFMCAGAIIQARVRRVVFGARDPRGGAVGSLANLLDNPLLNHKCHVTAGVLEAPSRTLLQSYFSERRGDSP